MERKIDIHKTKPSISNDGFTQISTLAQISKRFVQVVTKAKCMKVEKKQGLYCSINVLFEEYFKKYKKWKKKFKFFLEILVISKILNY